MTRYAKESREEIIEIAKGFSIGIAIGTVVIGSIMVFSGMSPWAYLIVFVMATVVYGLFFAMVLLSTEMNREYFENYDENHGGK